MSIVSDKMGSEVVYECLVGVGIANKDRHLRHPSGGGGPTLTIFEGTIPQSCSTQ